MFDEKSYVAALEAYSEFSYFLARAGREKKMQIHENAFKTYGEAVESMLREQFPEKVDLDDRQYDHCARINYLSFHHRYL